MEPKSYVAEDLLKMRWVGSPRLSPCGKMVAFVGTEILEKENTYASSLWLYDSRFESAGSGTSSTDAVRQISNRGGSTKGRDSNPKWSPNGKMIAFLSDRTVVAGAAGSGSQIFVLDMSGGEARQVTKMPKGVGDFDWLNDDALVFNAKEDEEAPKFREGATVRRITRLRYKFNGIGYLDGLHPQIYKVNLQGAGSGVGSGSGSGTGVGGTVVVGGKAASAGAVAVGGAADAVGTTDGAGETGAEPGPLDAEKFTEGPYDCGSPVASPSGKYVAFTSNRSGDEQALYSDLYVLETATRRLIKITGSLGHAGGPVFAPDESAVYYIGHEKGASYPGVYPQIWKADLAALGAGKSPGSIEKAGRKVISGEFPFLIGGGIGGDVGPDSGNSGLTISPCGQFLYFVAVDGGSSYLFRMTVKTGEWGRVYGEGQMVVKSYDVGGGQVVLNKSTPVSMGDLWYGRMAIGGVSATKGPVVPSCQSVPGTAAGPLSPAAPGNIDLEMITDFNNQLLSDRYAGWPERVEFKSPDGTTLEGWVILPKGYEAGKKYPLVMEIHGGPHSTYGNVFFHEFQMLAGVGFGVFYTNPRGSMGYGEEFARAVVGDWCGVDAQDLEFMAKEALRKFDWVDPKRFGVTGGSQGGYFTNWLVGHTDIFAAAVTQRSMSNLYSKYGVSDIGWSGDRAGMGGKDLWEYEDFIMERSPIRYARNVKTPTLVIHSDQDYRCPLEQGEQWYVALKRLGVQTEMLLFHGENHELSRGGKPANRIVRLEGILEWFKRFMG